MFIFKIFKKVFYQNFYFAINKNNIFAKLKRKEMKKISDSSKWNLLLMKRTNRFAIALFIIGISIKLISKYIF